MGEEYCETRCGAADDGRSGSREDERQKEDGEKPEPGYFDSKLRGGKEAAGCEHYAVSGAEEHSTEVVCKRSEVGIHSQRAKEGVNRCCERGADARAAEGDEERGHEFSDIGRWENPVFCAYYDSICRQEDEVSRKDQHHQVDDTSDVEKIRDYEVAAHQADIEGNETVEERVGLDCHDVDFVYEFRQLVGFLPHGQHCHTEHRGDYYDVYRVELEERLYDVGRDEVQLEVEQLEKMKVGGVGISESHFRDYPQRTQQTHKERYAHKGFEEFLTRCEHGRDVSHPHYA